ncbi:uncharacterized protein V6R79_013228 [Siganus canaliculatus]
MLSYKVTVFTGTRLFSGTFNHVFIKLVGTDGESRRIQLKDKADSRPFSNGAVTTFTVPCEKSIGKLVLIELDKKPFLSLLEDDWFAEKVEVKSPEGNNYTVPIYRWIAGREVYRFRDGKALRIFEDNSNDGRYSREQELRKRAKDYCWAEYAEGIPHNMKADSPDQLPPEVQFSFTKTLQFGFTAVEGMVELQLSPLGDNTNNWPDFESISQAFSKHTHISEYVMNHWKEDAFFGYQFLNGVNPMMIRRCTALPENFPVTDDMVDLDGGKSLEQEMKCGNIFLCDYKCLDGVETNTINDKKQFMAAPLVLLQKTLDDQLMPIAIQLKQTPGADNPIFVPSDPEYDWLLAKVYVRSAEFNVHQLNFHLLRTHLLAEVFAVSLLRNLPMVHPLYKLLIPHTRYTLQINNLARLLLISETGVFTRFAASGGEGAMKLLQDSLASVTYSSLCIPDDIAERGLKDVPDFYYRDDGLKLWKISNRFVEGVLTHYYKNDDEVIKDSELQKWIQDIFEQGFLSKADSGIPQRFTTVPELVKFVTMVIFTSSVQHAAVNSGQYDFGGWMPNFPTSMQCPPPTTKGQSGEATLLESLPAINTTVHGMATLWLLSKQSSDFISTVKMADYEVTVFTGNRLLSTTFSRVFIKLVGTDGQSHRTRLRGTTRLLPFAKGAVTDFIVPCEKSIGKLVLVELNKKHYPPFNRDSWFVDKVEVKSPEGDNYTVPIYRWFTDDEVQRFREGSALRHFEDDHNLGRYSREQELKQRAEDYGWDEYVKGIPHIMKADNPLELPSEVRFSFTKQQQFNYSALAGQAELQLSGLDDNADNWPDIDTISQAFSKRTEMSDYVQEHWMEDAFFGYQFLNGINPMMIRRCTALPKNFPVTDDMVDLDGGSSLEQEMKGGNIFLCDYKSLDGVKTNTINGKPQFMAAPLVLLQKTRDNQLMPIAIQLKQTPGADNPIFVPSDPEYDWLLAKVYVRSAEFNVHQLNFHLLRTHLLAEVFAVSLLRNLPMVHPLYKLLIPHTRYTLQINNMARLLLISETGTFTKFAASGGDGMIAFLQNSLSSITYSSLCIPDDIAERGLESVPNFFYRDDGLKLWNLIHNFVGDILYYYYKNDTEVQTDAELQKWILDIFERGFLCQTSTGIPQRFTTVPELVKFVTMVIFVSSAQHAAVNSGQYDFGGWMPNFPTSLQRPPPTTKGKSTEATLLETLPAVNTTVNGMASMYLLSKQSTDFVSLGHYPEDHFSEEIPRTMIKRFTRQLELLTLEIKFRNDDLEIPYTYLRPDLVENSVAI